MTSEIVVMNRSAVAMAADSAVTIDFGKDADGRPSRKVFNDANKLFALSKTDPVGIMVYSSSAFMGVNWELIIKWYREKRKGVSFDTLEEYVTDFFQTIGEDEDLFPREIRVNALLNDLCSFYHGMMLTKIEEEIEKQTEDEGKELGEYQIKRICTPIIKEVLNESSNSDFIKGFDEERIIGLQGKYSDIIDKATEEVFKKIPLSKAASTDLRNIALNLFSREIFPENYYSGVVIAGFGKKEPHPSYYEIVVSSCIFDNTLKHKMLGSSSCRDHTSVIKPFAQKEMVFTFMDGIDPEIRKFLEQYIGKICAELPDKIAGLFNFGNNENKKAARDRINGITEKIKEGLAKNLDGIKEQYSSPIVKLVNALSKLELANMAESLVNLTSFKRHITTAEETVGGPIDVAVISHGDGFVWINRKYYFKPELNQRLIAEYYKGE